LWRRLTGRGPILHIHDVVLTFNTTKPSARDVVLWDRGGACLHYLTHILNHEPQDEQLELIVVWAWARRYRGARWTCRTDRLACNRSVLFMECSQLDLLSLAFAILYPAAWVERRISWVVRVRYKVAISQTSGAGSVIGHCIYPLATDFEGRTSENSSSETV
jgi:hypothetical protein